MKKALTVFALMAFLFPSLASAVSQIWFDTPVYDFGSVTSGEQLHYGFRFTNGGDEDLQITRLSPS